MSVSVARPVPVVTPEVSLFTGDVMRDIKTPVVSPSSDPMAQPLTAMRTSSPEQTTVAHALTARRPSAGASIAEQIGIDLNAIGKAEARKIMSVEHRVLGFRPPHGSLAAEAQAAAAKHPDVKGMQPLDPEKLKEAAKVDAERILAERVKGEKEGESSDTVNGHENASEPAVDLTKITEDEARRLMSHEHRALGFRPPPGSLAAEAQAAASKHAESAGRNPADKPRQGSGGASAKPRRGSSENQGKPRQKSSSADSVGANFNSNGKRARSKRRGSDESARGGDPAARRASAGTAPSPSTKDGLLREAALRDAERIKATRGVDGASASEHAHVDVKDVAAEERKGESINLPAPAQHNVDPEAKGEILNREAVAARDTVVGGEGQDVNRNDITEAEVTPGELEHEQNTIPVMSRSETTDSVQIIGDVLV